VLTLGLLFRGRKKTESPEFKGTGPATPAAAGKADGGAASINPAPATDFKGAGEHLPHPEGTWRVVRF
jgi:hypothetical protein